MNEIFLIYQRKKEEGQILTKHTNKILFEEKRKREIELLPKFSWKEGNSH
jgi:hypothetical protein